jgi:gliding motility-associated-like protein
VIATSSSINNLCSGNYSVVVSNENYCNLSDTISITLGAQSGGPTIDATPDISTITEGDSVELNPTGGVSYTWNTSSSLTCFDCPNPIAQPSQNTIYIVTGMDINGCTGGDTVFVNVIPFTPPNFELPNIFTPNEDGENDRFLPFEEFPGRWQLTVFNRWGTEVFNTSNIALGWNGGDCISGTYYWIIEPLEGQQGEGRAGYVTLLRD